jgi:hypothetical protein
MKKYSGALLVIIFLKLSLLSCAESEFFNPEPDVTEKIQVDPFGEITVNGIFNIELRNDSLFSVTMTGKMSILDNISINVHGNSLVLDDMNRRRWLPDYPRVSLVISFPDVALLWLNAPVTLYSTDTLRVRNLDIVSAGQFAGVDLTLTATAVSLRTSGNDFSFFTLRGYAERSYIRIYGSAQVDAGGLATGETQVRNYSIGHAWVNAENRLRVWLEHYGNVYYRGDPDEVIIESMRSEGRLLEMD